MVLSSSRQQRIENARRNLEQTENAGDRLTIEELSERSQLSLATMTKVLAARIGVDKQTLDLVFVAFGLQMERTDYRQPEQNEEPALEIANDSPAARVIDWGEAIDVSMFYGREPEITTLTTWIQQDNCRLIALLGMGGIGKTALSVKIAQQLVQTDRPFESIVWRTLRNAPPLESLLIDIIQVLSCQQENLVAVPIPVLLNRLLHYLRSHRCLLVLDNGETILQGGEFAGIYRQDYEAYGELFRQVGEISHQSCLVLTSREKPETIANLEGIALPVRSIALTGLSPNDSDRLFESIGLSSSSTIDRHKLMSVYGGNPLALKIVATSIREIFDGDVDGFLGTETTVFNGIRRLLDQQYQRLTEIERQVMTWLAIDREWVTLAQLQADIVPAPSTQQLMEALESLARRSTIEKKNASFTQQPVVMEYITERLIDRVSEELISGELQLTITHALLKAAEREYIRESQRRLIVEPICARLLEHFQHRDALVSHLQTLFPKLQGTIPANYGAGNLLNLLCHLSADLTGLDLSGLSVRQAYLRNTQLHRVNLADSNLTQSIFADTITDIYGLGFSPDGSLLALGSGRSGMLYLYEMTTGRWLYSIPAHQAWVLSVTFDRGGDRLYTASTDGSISEWDVATGRCWRSWQTGCQNSCLSSSPDGRLLANGRIEGIIQIWDLATLQCLQTISAHQGVVTSVDFHPHQPWLVSSSTDSRVKLWNYQTGECAHIWDEHTDMVWDARFNSAGDLLVTNSSDGRALLWDLETKECIHSFETTPFTVGNITGITGLSEGTLATLKSLGAIDR